MNRRPHLVVVGDMVLDRDLEGSAERICPDAPAPIVDVIEERRGPGAAGLTALLCREEGLDVTLLAPVADDAEGAWLRRDLERSGVVVVPLPQEGTTRRKTRIRAAGQTLVRVDAGGPAVPLPGLSAAAREMLGQADGILVSCYGAGTTAHATLRAALADQARTLPLIWDPHPGGTAPVPGCALVTPNVSEARSFASASRAPADVLAGDLVRRWQAGAVAVTAGSTGAWLVVGTGPARLVPVEPVAGDSAGAGDRFAAAVAAALTRGEPALAAVQAAVQAAAAFVAWSGASGFRARRGRAGGASGAVPAPDHLGRRGRAAGVAAATRASGGVLVATGGCFDVLHAGHVQTLQAARRCGDALVVLLNSDDSVRRLKGPGRPVQPVADRAQVLLGLGCVDAVEVFEEDDPGAALSRLRPDVWAKGGDYREADLPESREVHSWGGRVVILPYLDGRSTTAILAATTTDTTTGTATGTTTGTTTATATGPATGPTTGTTTSPTRGLTA